MVENVWNHAEQHTEVEMNKIVNPSKSPPRLERSDYKAVWTNLSETVAGAKMHVMGSDREEDLVVSGAQTYEWLRKTVGIRPEDVVLEIGCGVGRVGKELAPHCRRWIGCDVSPHMLRIAAERLRGLSNVELKEINGYNLQTIPSDSIDVVYCTIVFMHLESWDRYSYVLEAMRVLRRGGRFYVDNANLCSEGGWKVFEVHRTLFLPRQRPPHITECSTPQEIETYLRRAGFHDVRLRAEDDFVRAWGSKP
jgi:SAM-dependent methyltransferase